MFFRNVKLSRECMDWLEKSQSFNVKQEKAEQAYNKVCAQIQDDVLKSLTTASKEPASEDGKTEVVVEVRLAKAEQLNTMMVVTRVYAVVHTKNNKKYYVKLDKEKQPKKVTRISDEIQLSVKSSKHFEVLKTIKQKKYRISM